MFKSMIFSQALYQGRRNYIKPETKIQVGKRMHAAAQNFHIQLIIWGSWSDVPCIAADAILRIANSAPANSHTSQIFPYNIT
jgi:hypothetical protein